MLRYDQKEIGSRIQTLRKNKKLTQEQLAEMLHISTSNLGKVERGLQGMSLDLLIDIADLFEETLDYIVFGRNPSKISIQGQLRAISDALLQLERSL